MIFRPSTRRLSLIVLVSIATLAAYEAPANARDNAASMVSLNSNGVPANGDSDAIAITPDSRFILFTSNGTNLPGAGRKNHPSEHLLYVRDLDSGTTRLASRDEQGTPVAVSGGVNVADISADGGKIAFASGGRVYVRERLGHAEIVSERADTELLGAYWPRLSPNGRRVAFVASTHRFREQPFAHDIPQDRTRLLLRDANGQPGATSWIGAPSLSGSGRYIAFEAEADASPTSCGSGEPHVYDWRSKAVTCPVSGWGADGPETLALSRTARYLAWHEYSLRLTDLQAAATHVFDIDDQDAEAIPPSWSANERFLAFLGYDESVDYVTYRFDRITGVTALVEAPQGRDFCEPSSRALTRSGVGVLVTCHTPEGSSSAFLITMPA